MVQKITFDSFQFVKNHNKKKKIENLNSSINFIESEYQKEV